MIILNGLVVIGLGRMSSGYRHNSLPISDLGVVDRQRKCSAHNAHTTVFRFHLCTS